MIVVTGATGQLGRLVIDALLETVPASSIVAAVRSPEKAADLAARGVVVRQADYTQAETLDSALAGAEKLLLISSSEIGQRVPQHRAVIEAAKRAGIKLIAYTSILRADTSPLGLATEHAQTEALLRHRACRSSCCAMAGTPRTTPPRCRRRWRTARFWAVPAMGAFRPLRASITRPRRPW